MSVAPNHTAASSPHAAPSAPAGTRTTRSGPIPVAWPLFWRFAKWRGGFPFGGVLIALGLAYPKYGGIALLGVFVVLTALMIRIVRKWRAELQPLSTPAPGAAQPVAEPVANPGAQAVGQSMVGLVEEVTYYGPWVGHEPAPGPYAAAADGDLPYR
jgi:hypothetical protein